MTNLFNYIDRPSPIHRLTGATKLLCLLLWSFAAMSTYDTRLLLFLAVFSLLLFAVSRIRLADVPEGVYLLHAAPLNLGGAEGAPCRATLISTDL